MFQQSEKDKRVLDKYRHALDEYRRAVERLRAIAPEFADKFPDLEPNGGKKKAGAACDR